MTEVTAIAFIDIAVAMLRTIESVTNFRAMELNSRSSNETESNGLRSPDEEPVEKDVERCSDNQSDDGRQHQSLSLKPATSALEDGVSRHSERHDLEVESGVLSDGRILTQQEEEPFGVPEDHSGGNEDDREEDEGSEGVETGVSRPGGVCLRAQGIEGSAKSLDDREGDDVGGLREGD